MIGLFVNRQRDSSGGVTLTPRPAAGIPVTARGQGLQGWAVASDGSSYSEELGSTPVPSTAIRSQGLAFTPDGALYTTVSAPTSTSAKIGGFAVRADGALHLADSSTVGAILQGIALTADGRLITGGTSFDLPLVNMSSGVFTLTPRSSTGSGTPTYTRATAATTIDFEGLLKTCLSGEVRCLGGRRVRNLIDKTESISADWSHSGAGSITAGATDPLGGTTAFTFTAGGANEEFYRVVAGAISIGDSVLSTAWVKRRTGSGTISLANASGGSFITIPVTSTWQRLSAGVATAGNTNALSDLKIVTSGDAVDFWHPQTENVTGQSNQNPSEYVSVGSLSFPYHGCGVDGVKYFTYLNGNTVV